MRSHRIQDRSIYGNVCDLSNKLCGVQSGNNFIKSQKQKDTAQKELMKRKKEKTKTKNNKKLIKQITTFEAEWKQNLGQYNLCLFPHYNFLFLSFFSLSLYKKTTLIDQKFRFRVEGCVVILLIT